jgi:ABC-type glycerol-3-phosphate transport system substrate-binding protein
MLRRGLKVLLSEQRKEIVRFGDHMTTVRMGLAAALVLALAGCTMMKAKQAPMPQTFLLFFHQWSPALTPEAKAIVDQASAKVKATGPSTVTVAGYTDNDGSTADKKRLAEGRVKTVQNAMVADGVDPKLFLSIPLGPPDDTAGMTGDRRIEIRLTYGH